MKRQVLIILALMLAIAGTNICYGQTLKEKLKEGDMIFHTSQSKQSPLIQYATGSHLTHCGIIIEKKAGLYVLEASKTLCLTPLDKFINRGKDRKWWVKRVIDKPVKIKYQHLLGRKYDSSFKKDNHLFYCSELIYYIYKNQFDIEICKYRKVSEYNLLFIKSKMKKRGINENQLVVAPVDIYNSNRAHDI